MNELTEFEQERTAAPSFLRQVVRRRASADGTERCELCGAELAFVHQHLLDPKQRQILCSCDACATVFCGQLGAHFLRVPRRIRVLADFQLADLQWEALMIPINLAFFFYDTAAGKMKAMYPSPAGAIESLLHLETWGEITADHSSLAALQPDVGCFLVNRVTSPYEYYLVPIDECFRLVGIIRMHWRGLSGGVEVWKEIARFFGELRARANVVSESARREEDRA